MGTENDGGLTADEMKFFETGDAAVLQNGLGTDEELPLEPTATPEPDGNQEDTLGPELSPAEVALENERNRRMDLERQLAEVRKAQPQKVEETLPDELTDPIGNMIAQLRQMREKQAAMETRLVEEQQKAELRQQYEEFAGNVRTMKETFAKEHTDFDAAYNHLRNIKIADMTDAGLSKTEATRRLNQDELQLAANALERGKNPAEVIYGMASRYGYKAQAAPAVAAATQKEAETRVQRMANGQFANRNPQRAAAPAAKELSSESLKDASENDLNKVVLDDKMWAQVVGGKPGGDIFHR